MFHIRSALLVLLLLVIFQLCPSWTLFFLLCAILFAIPPLVYTLVSSSAHLALVRVVLRDILQLQGFHNVPPRFLSFLVCLDLVISVWRIILDVPPTDVQIALINQALAMEEPLPPHHGIHQLVLGGEAIALFRVDGARQPPSVLNR